VKARRISYILRNPMKTLRKEHACLQFQNKLFQAGGQVFLPSSHRRCKNLSLSSLCCKENHRWCNPSRKNSDLKSELWSTSRVHEKDGFPPQKDTEFRHYPSHFSWLYGLMIYELNVSKHLNVTTTFQPHDGSASGAQNSLNLHKTDHIKRKKLVLKLKKILCCMFLLRFLALTVHKQQ